MNKPLSIKRFESWIWGQTSTIRNNATTSHGIENKVSLLCKVKEGMAEQLCRDLPGPARHREPLRRGGRASYLQNVDLSH